MELNQLLTAVRRWAWLIILATAAGLLAGFFAGKLQEPTYEASTSLLVSNELQGKNSDFVGLTNQQLVLTYVELLKTKQLRTAVSKKIGTEVGSDQITVQQVAGTLIINIKVQSSDPDQAAQIANAMVQALMEISDSMRSAQFSTLEDSLNRQIAQKKDQISELQMKYDQEYKKIYDQLYQEQISAIEKNLADIQSELSTLQTDIASLTYLTSVDARNKLAGKQARVDQLQSSFKIYDNMRANLLVSGKPMDAGNVSAYSELQQMKSTIDLYQKIYIGLLSDLETTRSNRLEQTANVVQIQEAYPASKPVRPEPLVYTLLGGVVGILLAGAFVFWKATISSDHK